MATTFRQLVSRFGSMSMLLKIILVNTGVFVALRLAVIIMVFSGHDNPEAVLRLVEMPSYLPALARRPWTVLTYMFTQYDVLHILFNMLWLYWFGVIFMTVANGHRLLSLYFLGGLTGAALYVAAYNVLPVFSGVHGMLIGASGAVIAIVAATAVMLPDFKMHLLFLGAVSLKWVALVTIGLDLIGVTGANAGGHIAHLGGALTGVVYALMLRRGRDITAPINNLFRAVSNLISRLRYPSKPRFTAFRRSRGDAPSSKKASCSDADRATLDAILDKIKKSGYTSLTSEERKRLFDVSSRIK